MAIYSTTWLISISSELGVFLLTAFISAQDGEILEVDTSAFEGHLDLGSELVRPALLPGHYVALLSSFSSAS